MFWATSASAFKITLRYIDFLSLVFYSIFFALVVLFFINLYKRNFHNFEYKSHIKSIYFGFFVPFLYYILLFLGYSLLKGQEMLILNNTWQIFLLIFSAIFILRRIKLNEILGIALSFIGVVVLATKGDISSLDFDSISKSLIGISCAILWSLYWTISAKDERKIEMKLFFNFLFGFAYISIFILFFGKLTFNILGILGSLYIALFEMSITFIIYAKALSYEEDIPKIANLMYFIPIISLILLSVLVGERIEFYVVISAILIIFGIFISSR
ncbi:MAG: DMT family transporter [candidate division WOR-3 bacterium]|nr:DMT family transporter [candidate division WOR-3 bacterium]